MTGTTPHSQDDEKIAQFHKWNTPPAHTNTSGRPISQWAPLNDPTFKNDNKLRKYQLVRRELSPSLFPNTPSPVFFYSSYAAAAVGVAAECSNLHMAATAAAEYRVSAQEGLNWLVYCWYNRRGSILADEMGLGKTVQVRTGSAPPARRE